MMAASGHSFEWGTLAFGQSGVSMLNDGLMQIGDSRYVLQFPLQSHPRDVKTESAAKCRACRLVLSILSYRPSIFQSQNEAETVEVRPRIWIDG
jgi:hypothetical protein